MDIIEKKIMTKDYLTKSTRLLAKIPPENITNLIKLFFGLMVKDKSLNEICSQKYFFTFLYDQLELVIQRGHNVIIPKGITRLMPNDSLIIFTREENSQKIIDFFRG